MHFQRSLTAFTSGNLCQQGGMGQTQKRNGQQEAVQTWLGWCVNPGRSPGLLEKSCAVLTLGERQQSEGPDQRSRHRCITLGLSLPLPLKEKWEVTTQSCGLSICEAFLTDETLYRGTIQTCSNSPACTLMIFEEWMNAIHNLPSLLSLYQGINIFVIFDISAHDD